MRKILIAFCVVMITFPLMAQQRTGNIYGTVVDTEGNPLPGVTVTLTGSLTAPVPTVTSAKGKFKFISLSPADDYTIKAELQNFNTRIEQGLIVTVGRNIDITLIMEMSALKIEVIVTAKTPVVDRKSIALIHTIPSEMLQSLPTPRDPWQIANMAPSIIMDRENVGGSESGLQTLYGAHGDDFRQNVFSVDGAVVTDVCSRGMPNTYDIDAIKEVSITVGGSDVTAKTGGIALNMVTKRGGDKMSISGRFFITDEAFQATNLTDKLKEEGVQRTNKIQDIRDYGLNLGGPFIKSKAWYWIGAGVQDIKRFNILGTTENYIMTNFNGKINLQLIPANKLEFYGAIQRVEGWGKSASASRPLGRHRMPWYNFGNPLIKIQDEHMFGDKLFVSARFTYNESGYREKAMFNDDNEKIQLYNVTSKVYDQYNLCIQERRPRKDMNILAQYYNDNLLGMSHEIKAGFEYSHKTTYKGSRGYTSFNYNYYYAIADIDGDGRKDIVPDIYRAYVSRFGLSNWTVNSVAVYFSDSISTGRFNVMLGFRYDIQSPKVSPFTVDTNIAKDHPVWYNNFTLETADVINRVFPSYEVPEIDPDYNYSVFSPRIGITYDIQGNGKTIAKLSLAEYGDLMTTGAAYYWTPLGVSARMYFYWLDTNEDGITDYTELLWINSRYKEPRYALYRVFDDAGNFIGDWEDSTLWSGFDPADPTQTTDPNYFLDKNAWYGGRTQEVILSLEREIARDFGVSLNLIYKKYYDAIWNLDYYPDTDYKRSKDDYVQVGTVPDQVGEYSTEGAAGKPYYLLAGDQEYTPYDYRTRRPDFNQKYYGIELVFNKRLSNKWMLNGSLCLQTQNVSNGENGYLDPTNLWAIDKSTYAHSMGGGSGRLGQYIFSNWILKFSGLYQLPYGFNVSLNLSGREGYVIKESFHISDDNAPNTRYRSVEIYLNKFGNLQLPNMWKADLRVEKVLNVGDYGKIYLMADLFNIFNSSTVNRRYQRHLGTYYIREDPADNEFIPDPQNYLFNAILSPRVLRLGIRFQF